MPIPSPEPSASTVTEWPPAPGDHSPFALFVVTADGRVRVANRTATAWFKVAPLMSPFARFIGVADYDLEDRSDELDAFMASLRAHGEQRELRLTLYRHPGGIFSALLIATPLNDEDGHYLGFDAVLLDLGRWRDREALVPPTASESLQRRLTSSERSLGMLQRETESLLQVLGHDARGPLRHLQAYLQLVSERAQALDDASLKEYGEGAMRSAQGLGQMIEAMHDYLYLCRAPIRWQQVSLGPLVHSLLGHLPSSRVGHGVDWRIAPDLPAVRGDPVMLAQLFRHVLDNAVKFTRRVERPVVSINWSYAVDGGLVFYVDDNGVGFDRGSAQRLFLLFQRQHHSRDYEGLGVGLAMAHRIVERHGGQMFCDAAPGGGCQLRFILLDEPMEGMGGDSVPGAFSPATPP